MKTTAKEHCPCGTGKSYSECCGVFITDKEIPSTPEQLMRSRYTAYTRINLDYIEKTMKSPALDDFNPHEVEQWASKVRWSGLEVVKTSHILNKGIVEFRAYYTIDGKKSVLHEISEFSLENGQWYYVIGRYPKPKNT